MTNTEFLRIARTFRFSLNDPDECYMDENKHWNFVVKTVKIINPEQFLGMLLMTMRKKYISSLYLSRYDTDAMEEALEDLLNDFVDSGKLNIRMWGLQIIDIKIMNDGGKEHV